MNDFMNEMFVQHLLNDACPQNVIHDGKNYAVMLFWIETHCVGHWVTAYWSRKTTEWEVISWTSEDC